MAPAPRPSARRLGCRRGLGAAGRTSSSRCRSCTPAARTAVVATSLGNLVFDQHTPGTARGALLEVLAGRGGVRAFRSAPPSGAVGCGGVRALVAAARRCSGDRGVVVEPRADGATAPQAKPPPLAGFPERSLPPPSAMPKARRTRSSSSRSAGVPPHGRQRAPPAGGARRPARADGARRRLPRRATAASCGSRGRCCGRSGARGVRRRPRSRLLDPRTGARSSPPAPGSGAASDSRPSRHCAGRGRPACADVDGDGRLEPVILLVREADPSRASRARRALRVGAAAAPVRARASAPPGLASRAALVACRRRRPTFGAYAPVRSSARPRRLTPARRRPLARRRQARAVRARRAEGGAGTRSRAREAGLRGRALRLEPLPGRVRGQHLRRASRST